VYFKARKQLSNKYRTISYESSGGLMVIGLGS
jgi:hypothetical protein